MPTPDGSPARRPGAAGLWREFWGGVNDLSGLSLTVCAALFALVAAVLLWLFNPATMAGPMGAYIPRSSQDADAFATVEALRLRAHPPDRATLLFVGSSAVAQMVGNGRALQDRLAGLPDGPWQVRVLTTPLQSPLDQMRLLETALAGRNADSPPMIVAIGIGLSRLGWTGARLRDTEAASRVPLASDWAAAELAALGAPPPGPQRPWILTHRRFVVLNGTEALIRLALQSPAPRRVDVYATGRAPVDRSRNAILSQIGTGLQNSDAFFDLQHRLAAHALAAPGVTVVFVEEPLSPEIREIAGLDPVLDRFRRDSAAMAADVGAEFWPIMRGAALAQADFFDDLHIRRGQAQTICQTEMAESLAGLLETQGDGT